MFRWWRFRGFRNDVYAQTMAMTLLIGPEGQTLFKHDGISNAISEYFDSDVPASVAATHISAALMAHSIEQNEDTNRKIEVEASLSRWAILDSAAQRNVRKQMREGTLEQDMLLTRCQWLLLMGQDLLLENKISKHDFVTLRDSIYGPLKGERQDTRLKARLSDELDKLLGLNSAN